MTDALQDYYQRELEYVREHLYRRYARDNPVAASELGIRPNETNDPWLSQLVDAFAFLSARIERKLKDGFPEVLEGFLNVLYPQYLRPFPSHMVVQFQLGNTRGMQTTATSLEKHTELETDAVDGETLRYRTTQPAELFPISEGNSSILRPPYAFGGTLAPKAQSGMKLELNCISPQMTFSQFEISRPLQLFVSEKRTDSFELLQFLCHHLIGIAVLDGNDELLAELPPDALRPTGFSPDEQWLPGMSRAFPGYGLIAEFFAYRERFSFVNLDLASIVSSCEESSIRVVFFFDRQSERLESSIHPSSLRLGCVPAVNLFSCDASPIENSQTTADYPVVVDKDRIWCHEVFDVDSVVLFEPDSQSTHDFQPIFSPFSIDESEPFEFPENRNYYTTRREYVAPSNDIGITGSDMFISTGQSADVDDLASDRSIFRVRVTALNRDLPNRMLAMGGEPGVQMANFQTGVTSKCLVAPSRTIRPQLTAEDLWRVVSHLRLNHLSLANKEALREFLSVYNLICDDEQRSDFASRIIRSIQSVESEQMTERVVAGGRATFARGVHISLQLDSSSLPPGSAYLFGLVLSEFFATYANINSLARTTVFVDGRRVMSNSKSGLRHTV